MSADFLCTEQAGDESTNTDNGYDENSIQVPYHLYQFLSTCQNNTEGICRICLTTDNNIMFPLYSAKATNMLANMFTALTTIKVYPEEGLPTNVCESCQNHIMNAYNLKIQCEKANIILKSVLKCFAKDNDNNNSIGDDPHNINDVRIKEEDDILRSEGMENLDDVSILQNKVKEECSTLVPKTNDTQNMKEESDISKSEDVDYLHDIIATENYELCILPYTNKRKKKEVTVSVTDSNTVLRKIVSKKKSTKQITRKYYSCKVCSKKFCKLKLLRAHLNNNHPTDNHKKVNVKQQKVKEEFSCNQCRDSFSLEHDLQLHLMLHSADPTWKCNKCDKVFESKSLLRRHIFRHMEAKRYSCETCGKLFTEMYALKRHVRVHTGEIVLKKHECHLCDKKYRESGLLAAHIARHEGVRPFVCSVCGKNFPSSRLLTSHSLTHTEDKPYACTYCSKRFRHESTRITHQRTHTGEKPYICSICGKTFIQNSNLTLHMRTHTGEKPYSCSICNRKFSSGSSVKVHERTHTGERPYECKVCGKRFARQNMRVHMLNHSGERPYACAMCPKKFIKASRLREHSRVHTGEKPFECEKCSRKFQTKSHLIKHLKSHTKQKKPSKRLEQYNKKKDFKKENVLTEHRTIVFDVEEVPIELDGEILLQDENNVKTKMLIIDNGQNYQTQNILNGDSVIVSDINYGNNLVTVNDGDVSIATTEAVLEGATVKLYQLDQSLLQIHSAGGQLTISKITSKMTANF